MVTEETPLEIIWSPTAVKELKEIYLYLQKDSKSTASKVRSSILNQIEKLTIYPTVFELDRFMSSINENYRAFEKYRYRVVYKHTEGELHIIRIRHTSREPLGY